jgi:serine/threonine protein kinase
MQPTQGRRYRILEVLGSGGFGTVYRAEMLTHSGLRREVALKVLNEQTAGDEEAARRLRDEARILGTLNHFGIVRVDDLLQLDGRWTMVMELVRGWDCEKLLGEYGVFPTSVSLDIVAGVARTLHAVSKAHGPEGQPLELVHRDVKPANILLTVSGAPKLLDFGVARAQVTARESDTQQAYVMGSLPYLAPERYGFEDLPAGDVYALGCVLYELLLGERFGRTRPSHAKHVKKLREALHKAWDRVEPEAREGVLQVLAETLAYEPEARPAPRDLAARIEEIRHKVRGPRLADWAEDRVGALLARGHGAQPDDLCGRVLTENLSGESMAGPLPADELWIAGHDSAPPERTEFTVPKMAPPSRPPPALQELSTVPPDDGDPDEPPLDRERPTTFERTTTAQAPPPTRPVPPPPPAGRRKAGAGALVAVVGGGALLAVAAVALAVALNAPSAPEPVPVAPKASLEDVMEDLNEGAPPIEHAVDDVDFGAVEATDIVQGTLEEEAPVRQTPVDATPAREAPVREAPVREAPVREAPVREAPVREASPPTPEDPAEDAPAAADAAEILVYGDAEFVMLRGPSGRAEPGSVAPGSWTLFPSFPGGQTIKGPTVTLAAGESARFRCSSSAMTCSRE